MFTEETSLIIPTRNRSYHILKLINQLKKIKIEFNEIIIVDSSDDGNANSIKSICLRNSIKYYYTIASTAHQRNYGLLKKKKNKFVMFMDDDVVVNKNTFIEVDKLINKYKNNRKIAGYGFNQIDKSYYSFFDKIKNLKIISKLNLYPYHPGRVSKSGWHSKILNLKEDTLGDWVFTTICIYNCKDIINYKFNESFGKYSYLEDLDFSLNLKKKKKKILISHLARFEHPKNIDRSNFQFGVIEILNRYKIVKKHNLSIKLFIVVAFMRFIYSLMKSFKLNIKYFSRAMGNIFGFFLIFKIKKINIIKCI